MVAIELSETEIWNPTAPLPRRPTRSAWRRRRQELAAVDGRQRYGLVARLNPMSAPRETRIWVLVRAPIEKPQRIPPPFPLLALLELLP